MMASTISGELQQAAKTLLFLQLTALSNRGINLWAIQKYVLHASSGQAVYPLPLGITDLTNVLSRLVKLLTPTSLSSGAGYVQAYFAQAVAVGNVSVVFSAPGTVYLVMQCSQDGGTTWQNIVSLQSRDVNVGDRIVFDLDNTKQATLWRLLDQSGVMVANTLYLHAPSAQDLPMTRLNKDDYQNLPNKQFVANGNQQSLQYWYDKQTNPQIWVWPVPGSGAQVQIVVWGERQIEDIGALSNEIDVPQRWYKAVMAQLAADLMLEIPPQELPPGREQTLLALAVKEVQEAEDGESDGAPTRLAPNLRSYTA